MNCPNKDGDHNINCYLPFLDSIIGKVIIISLQGATNYAGLFNKLKRFSVLNLLTVLTHLTVTFLFSSLKMLFSAMLKSSHPHIIDTLASHFV